MQNDLQQASVGRRMKIILADEISNRPVKYLAKLVSQRMYWPEGFSINSNVCRPEQGQKILKQHSLHNHLVKAMVNVQSISQH